MSRGTKSETAVRPVDEVIESKDGGKALEEIEALRQNAKVAEQQRDEYLTLLRRTQADFENYQKRNQRDLADERRYCHSAFARELLPVLDNLRRTLDAARQQGDQGPLVQGAMLTLSQLLDVFRRFGISPIEPFGEPFDPQLHEAVLQTPHPGVPAGTVTQVLEPGYRLHERVLRPAKVAVAAPETANN